MKRKNTFIILLLSFIIISCGKYQDNMLIKDDKFQVYANCDARGILEFSMKNNKLYWRDLNSMTWNFDAAGILSHFCHGAVHVWVGKVKFGFYTFISSKDDPLQFVVDRNIGYYYIAGKGKVITPEGKTIRLRMDD